MDTEYIKHESRRLIKLGSLTLILLSLFLLFAALGAMKSWRSPDVNYNSISISGMGEAVSVPDISTFNFSVSSDADTVAEAQANVTEKMDKILAGLKDLGIEDKDIKTSDYSVWPKYTYEPTICPLNSACPPSRQIADGYTVSHTVLVKVRNTDNAGKALSIVGDNGATNVSGLTFTTDDPEKALNEARAKAIDDARSKAEDLAKHLGVRIVRVVGYSDSNSPVRPVYSLEAMGGASKSLDSASPTLPVGENKATVNVTVEYEIR
jgi:uncharacterized protein YggE